MLTKLIIFIFITIGSLVGGFVPLLWGGSLFSYSGILFSGIGGILGLWIALKLTQPSNSL
ncbi:MAG TPA: hypothetical protein VG935_00840 [Patescibacteria group bacterium]|nr:hypothetical protein [Patescibacteria group bacterium]